MDEVMEFSGIVQDGKKRGKGLGFPTANVSLTQDIAEGIYLSRTKVDVTWHSSLTFIGSAKTFGDTTFQAEIYILSFHENLYQKEITNRLIKKIRSNRKFHSAEALVAQMQEDERIAKEYFANYK